MKTLILALFISCPLFAQSRADQAFDSLIKNFWEENRGDFKGENHYWFYAQSFDIAAMYEERSPSDQNKKFLDRLYKAQLARGYIQTGTTYYDDEAWMAMALIRSWKVTKNTAYLQTAKALLLDIMKAEVKSPSGETLGVRWSSQSNGVATASSMGAVITAVMLYKITHDESFILFAQRVYQSWKESMLDPITYQVADFQNADGSKEWRLYTYDQGLMIGAAIELFTVTKDKNLLEDARGMAAFVMREMSHKNILVEPLCQQSIAECRKNQDLPQFKGITVKFLMELVKVDGASTELADFLKSTIDSLWTLGRDSRRNLFSLEWDGTDVVGESSYGSANSAAMALASYEAQIVEFKSQRSLRPRR